MSEEERKANGERLNNTFVQSEDLIDLLGDEDFSQDSALKETSRRDTADRKEPTKRTFPEVFQALDMTDTKKRETMSNIEGDDERLRRLKEENTILRDGLEAVIKATGQGPLIAQHVEMRQLIISHRHLYERAGTNDSGLHNNSPDNSQSLPHLVKWLMADLTHAITKQRAACNQARILENLCETLQDQLAECTASRSRDACDIRACLLETEDCGSQYHSNTKAILHSARGRSLFQSRAMDGASEGRENGKSTHSSVVSGGVRIFVED